MFLWGVLFWFSWLGWGVWRGMTRRMKFLLLGFGIGGRRGIEFESGDMEEESGAGRRGALLLPLNY